MKSLVVTKRKQNILCAWFDEKRLVQVHVDSFEGTQVNVGDIYLGKVKNVVKNINAAFIEILPGIICFMQMKNESLQVKNEQEVLVQVQREALKTKQPAVTMELDLPGKYLVATSKRGIRISSKIGDVHTKKRLRNLLESILDTEYGFVVRTNACQASEEELFFEAKKLVEDLKSIQSKKDYCNVFTKLYEPPQQYLCAIRDLYYPDLDRIVTDDDDIYQNIKRYIQIYSGGNSVKCEMYKDENYSLSALYSLEDKLSKALQKRVWLDSGAYLIIEHTEACTVIDVNTGKAIRKKGVREEYFLQINKEAACEILHQLRLRNISGMIIVDFIDLENPCTQQELMQELKKLAKLDPVKTTIVDYTKLGLVEMTRKKVMKPLYEQIIESEYFPHKVPEES